MPKRNQWCNHCFIYHTWDQMILCQDQFIVRVRADVALATKKKEER